MIFPLRVIPNSSKSEVVGEYAGGLKIKLTAPPVGGKANSELIKCLSEFLKISKNRIEIISGETAKNKTVRIKNMNS